MEFAKDSKNLVRTLYASTSSVYGGNIRQPFQESHGVDHPLQFYAVSKRTNELMAHAYSNLYGTECIGLRFFTVYGPWGRPDMALFKFTKNILKDKEIDVYNNGEMKRNFTYIDDLIKSILKLIPIIPSLSKSKFIDDSLSNVAPWRVVNIGGGEQTHLMDFIKALELALGKKAKKNFLMMQIGDVIETESSNKLLEYLTNYSPSTSIQYGIEQFVNWYRQYNE